MEEYRGFEIEFIEENENVVGIFSTPLDKDLDGKMKGKTKEEVYSKIKEEINEIIEIRFEVI